MKPSFALHLTHDGITLLHRSRGGWVDAGSVALDNPEINERLAWLRKTAAALARDGVTTKLVIPNSEILYDTVTAPGPDEAAREAQIRAGLEGRTPYDVNDLVFDYRAEGDIAHIAVVARETLVEAEAFATEHRFNPVCFVAIPDDDAFGGEPNFGLTRASDTLVDPADPLERDDEAIRIIGTARPAGQDERAPVVHVADDAPAAEALPPILTAALNPDPVPDPEEATEADGEDRQDDDAPDTDAEAETDKAEADGGKKDDVPAEPAPEPVVSLFASRRRTGGVEAPATGSPDEVGALVEQRAARMSFLSEAAAPPPEAGERPEPAADEAGERGLGRFKGMAARAFSFGKDDPSEDAPEPRDAPKSITDAPRLFGSGPAQPPERPAAPAVTRGRSGITLPPMPRLRLGGAQQATAAVDPGPEALSDLAEAPAEIDAAPQPVAVPTPEVTPAAEETPAPPRAARPFVAFSSVVPDRDGTQFDERAARVREVEPLRSVPTAVAEITDAATRAIGSLGGMPAAAATRPPMGLIAAAALLVVLILGAVAVLLFGGDDGAEAVPDAPAAQVETAAAVPAAPLVPEAAVSATDEALADEAAADEAVADADTAEPATTDTAAADAPPAALSLVEAEAAYAATGIWQRGPEAPPAPASTEIDSLYVATLDPEIGVGDAVALPGYVGGRDFRPISPRPPVAPGQTFELDANGLVVPTPDGAVSPDGVRVHSVAPPVTPPERPARIEQDAALAPDAAAPLRPRARPGNATEIIERAALGGYTRAQLAALKPRARPESEQAIAAAEALADGVDADTASPLAVASSRSPAGRPSNIAELVAEARRLAPEPETRVTRVAAVAPAGPTIPTRASVARQATIQNAISLRQVNLIGVYGTPSDRRALVRLANGRYVKVEVGDRVDGGRVAAIGDSSLQYVKNNRNITLAMPD